MCGFDDVIVIANDLYQCNIAISLKCTCVDINKWVLVYVHLHVKLMSFGEWKKFLLLFVLDAQTYNPSLCRQLQEKVHISLKLQYPVAKNLLRMGSSSYLLQGRR